MIRLAKAAALPAALLALAGCKVTVDNQTQAQIDNTSNQVDSAADKAGSELGNAADAAGNTADRLGNDIEKGADKIGNGVSVHVNLHGDKDDKSDGNSQ
jgi:hypothetical protein